MTTTPLTDIVQTLEMPHGLEIDLDEAWRKLISRQFGGDPSRAFAELIQNFIDSYPAGVAWENRRAEIVTDAHSISITDWGEGMNRDRLKLLVTLGGTDKDHDETKIGRFGIGFFSIFNPDLGTRRVVVHTRCEGRGVELVFTVAEPARRPVLSAKVHKAAPDFGRRVTVEVDNDEAPGDCVRAAKKALRHFPCPVTIDGNPAASVWLEAQRDGLPVFEHDQCRGFLCPTWHGNNVTILRRYERLLDLNIGALTTGGHGMTWDLRDLQKRAVPWLPGTSAVINSNDLTATISRDGFYLDAAWERMVRALGTALEQALGEELARLVPDSDSYLRLAISNQYVLSDRLGRHIRACLAGGAVGDGVLALLAEAPVYRLCGKRDRVSLLDIARRRSSDLPVFHVPSAEHEGWLGGAFRHDFIVAPLLRAHEVHAPSAYDAIFRAAFGSDVINLDTIRDNTNTIGNLVDRGIVDPALLTPRTFRVAEQELDAEERALLGEINALLEHSSVADVLRRGIGQGYLGVRASFFESDCAGLAAATGLFDDDGQPNKPVADTARKLGRIHLGLRRSHSIVHAFVRSSDPMRAFFAVSFLAQRLVESQKALVPHNRLAHTVPDQLGTDLRQAMLRSLVVDPPSGGAAAA